MKTRPSSFLALLAVLGAASVSPLAAAPAGSIPADLTTADRTMTASHPARAYPLGAVERYGVTAFRLGDSANRVVAYLGNPDQKLSDGTWVYRGFQCQSDLEFAKECTTLLISFNQGRVSDLMRLNEPAVRVIAAQLAARVPARRVVAGK